jgi:hypothetical protein
MYLSSLAFALALFFSAIGSSSSNITLAITTLDGMGFSLTSTSSSMTIGCSRSAAFYWF